jgi:hypothetical protein
MNEIVKRTVIKKISMNQVLSGLVTETYRKPKVPIDIESVHTSPSRPLFIDLQGVTPNTVGFQGYSGITSPRTIF